VSADDSADAAPAELSASIAAHIFVTPAGG
jgi:hypothetical protein